MPILLPLAWQWSRSIAENMFQLVLEDRCKVWTTPASRFWALDVALKNDVKIRDLRSIKELAQAHPSLCEEHLEQWSAISFCLHALVLMKVKCPQALLVRNHEVLVTHRSMTSLPSGIKPILELVFRGDGWTGGYSLATEKSSTQLVSILRLYPKSRGFRPFTASKKIWNPPNPPRPYPMASRLPKHERSGFLAWRWLVFYGELVEEFQLLFLFYDPAAPEKKREKLSRPLTVSGTTWSTSFVGSHY